ncbi:MAG: T9SS type A sorting domain-containing protein [Bacteroidetes bacterium]|nr:T9SS type A sorting domain-containing protein [Bacteroidota bacterium]
MKKPAFLVLACLLLTIKLNAQACVDSIHIQSNYPCFMNNYQPVCGCDNVTYPNSCVAQYRHGLTKWREGICEPLDFYFYPTFPNDVNGFYLNVNVTLKQKGNAHLYIFNLFGKLYHEDDIKNIDVMDTRQIDTQSYPNGIYFIAMRTPSGYAKIKRFEKYGQ